MYDRGLLTIVTSQMCLLTVETGSRCLPSLCALEGLLARQLSPRLLIICAVVRCAIATSLAVAAAHLSTVLDLRRTAQNTLKQRRDLWMTNGTPISCCRLWRCCRRSRTMKPPSDPSKGAPPRPGGRHLHREKRGAGAPPPLSVQASLDIGFAVVIAVTSIERERATGSCLPSVRQPIWRRSRSTSCCSLHPTRLSLPWHLLRASFRMLKWAQPLSRSPRACLESLMLRSSRREI